MSILDTILAWISFALVCFAVCVAPWLFGAWEMWWFWPFAVCIFAAAFCFSVRLVSGGRLLRTHRLHFTPAGTTVAVSFAVFLAYAFVRSRQSPVFMDAERSLMLFLTSFLLAGVIVIGFSRSQLRALYAMVVVNLLCLGLYGIINHWVTGSHKVLWVTSGFTQYAGRATGTYFCPDHYSGLMELLLALALGLLLAPRADGNSDTRKTRYRIWMVVAGLMIPVALYGVWISQSRGGGLTVLAILAAALLVWTGRFRSGPRWGIRLGGLAVCIAVVVMLWNSNSTYINRFKELTPFDRSGGLSLSGAAESASSRIKENIRYNMYSAAYRAWLDTDPWFGIGPGMHQHLWFHYAASPDGDRARGIWPSRPNFDTHAHQVHNDWLQLLEEYGVAGIVIFLVWTCAMLVVLIKGYRLRLSPAMALGAGLCLACMAMHSLVDFNLQIPATVWLFAVVLAVPFALIQREAQ
ncbi:MAG: O-antigen ligase family protein [bacterium]